MKVEVIKYVPEKKSFTCHLCEYKHKSETVLKRHISMKHKENIPTPEKERTKDGESSPQMTIDEMAKALYCPPQPRLAGIEVVKLKCEYWTCQYHTENTEDLERHIKVEHVVDDTFKYPESTEEDECPDCDKVFFMDHNFAMPVYEEHLYSFTCSHCHKHLPGENEMSIIHYKMCLAPCDGHPLCLCKI